MALDREKQAQENAEMSPEKKQKLAGAREKATGDKLKVSREVNTEQVFTSNHCSDASKLMTGTRKLNVLHLNASEHT